MKPPVWLEGDGFLTEDGRYYSEEAVRAGLLRIAEWWGGLTDEEHVLLCQLGHYAQVDQEIDAAVFGEDR